MTCNHKRTGIVTSYADGYSEGLHAAESVCDREPCIAAAIYRVQGITGMNAVRKFRADCTQADVATIRDARIAAANALMTEGRREDLLLKKMKRLKAATVGDLPQSSIVEVLSWQP